MNADNELNNINPHSATLIFSIPGSGISTYWPKPEARA